MTFVDIQKSKQNLKNEGIRAIFFYLKLNFKTIVCSIQFLFNRIYTVLINYYDMELNFVITVNTNCDYDCGMGHATD